MRTLNATTMLTNTVTPPNLGTLKMTRKALRIYGNINIVKSITLMLPIKWNSLKTDFIQHKLKDRSCMNF